MNNSIRIRKPMDCREAALISDNEFNNSLRSCVSLPVESVLRYWSFAKGTRIVSVKPVVYAFVMEYVPPVARQLNNLII